MIVAVTAFVLVGTLLTATLLLGRFTLMIVGLLLTLSTTLMLLSGYVNELQTSAMIALGAVLMLAGRPSWLRRGHRDRTTRIGQT